MATLNNQRVILPTYQYIEMLKVLGTYIPQHTRSVILSKQYICFTPHFPKGNILLNSTATSPILPYQLPTFSTGSVQELHTLFLKNLALSSARRPDAEKQTQKQTAQANYVLVTAEHCQHKTIYNCWAKKFEPTPHGIWFFYVLFSLYQREQT